MEEGREKKTEVESQRDEWMNGWVRIMVLTDGKGGGGCGRRDKSDEKTDRSV